MDQNTNQPKRALRADDGMPRHPTLQECNRALVRPSVDPLEVKRATETLQRAAAEGLVPAVPTAPAQPAPVAVPEPPAPAVTAEQSTTPAPLPPAWGSGGEQPQG